MRLFLLPLLNYFMNGLLMPPSQYVYLIWARTAIYAAVLYGTGFLLLTGNFTEALMMAGSLGVLAVLLSFPSAVLLRFVLPRLLALPTARKRMWMTGGFVTGCFLLTAAPICLAPGITTPDFWPKRLDWREAGFLFAFAAPFWLSGLLATAVTCRNALFRPSVAK